MKRQDASLIHHRNLYNYKVHHEPTLESFPFSPTTYQHSDTDSEIKNASFVVEWQLQVNETKGFDENSPYDAKAEFANPIVETKEPYPGSADKEPAASIYISGRKVNYWVF
jgi:hypothetical protein